MASITFTSLGEPAMVLRPSKSWKYLTCPVGLIPQFCNSVDRRWLFVISSPAAVVPAPFAPARREMAYPSMTPREERPKECLEALQKSLANGFTHVRIQLGG